MNKELFNIANDVDFWEACMNFFDGKPPLQNDPLAKIGDRMRLIEELEKKGFHISKKKTSDAKRNKHGVPMFVDLLVKHPDGIFLGYKKDTNNQKDVFFVKEFPGQSSDKTPYAMVGCTAWMEIGYDVVFNEIPID